MNYANPKDWQNMGLMIARENQGNLYSMMLDFKTVETIHPRYGVKYSVFLPIWIADFKQRGIAHERS